MPIELKGTIKPGGVDRRYYMIRVQVAGRRVVVSADTRRKDVAQRKETALLEALRDNPAMSQADVVALVRGEGSLAHRTAVKSSRGMTLHQAFQKCLKSPVIWGRIRSHGDFTIKCATIEGIMGADTPLPAITEQSIDHLRDTLLREGIEKPNGTRAPMAGATVNRHLAVLRHMFNVATGRTKKSGRWPEAPQSFPHVAKVDERGPREYFMPPEDEGRMMAALSELDSIRPGAQGGPPRKKDAHRYRLLFAVMIETGMRRGEALRLRWADISMPRDKPGVITLLRRNELKTKASKRSIPITPTCQAALEACKGVEHGPFADCNPTRMRDIWNAAKKRAGIKHRDCVPHSLRHTCASRLLQAGVGLFETKEWMGHASINTTLGYAHMATGMLAGAAEKLVGLRNSDATEEAK